MKWDLECILTLSTILSTETLYCFHYSLYYKTLSDYFLWIWEEFEEFRRRKWETSIILPKQPSSFSLPSYVFISSVLKSIIKVRWKVLCKYRVRCIVYSPSCQYFLLLVLYCCAIPVMAILQDHLDVPSRTLCSACSRLSIWVSGSTENKVLSSGEDTIIIFIKADQ